jgi:hypothetical protein
VVANKEMYEEEKHHEVDDVNRVASRSVLSEELF